MAIRTYVVDLPGGTNTSSIQIQGKQTFKKLTMTFINAAVGKTEFSKSVSPQIGTAQPTADVIARVNHSATAGNQTVSFDISQSVQPFQTIYIHQTGTGNLGTAVLS